ncbi:MAG: acyl-CoA dehydratase activase [Coriobacteriales bacterium]|jgi:predicted CoA-substrate-specific enzyme activase
MIGYVCKYAPVELIRAFGGDAVRIEPHVTGTDTADALMHPNLCSYAKAVFEEVRQGDYEALVLTTCCDSIRRLADAVNAHCPDTRVFVLDLPRESGRGAVARYAKELSRLADELQQLTGRSFERACLIELLADAGKGHAAGEAPSGKPRVGIAGARHNTGSLERLLEDAGLEVAFDASCVGMRSDVRVRAADLAELDFRGLMERYAAALLEQLPCMRMADTSKRTEFFERELAHVDGLVYHTVKFCDMYSFEYAELHAKAAVPILKIETDMTAQSSGQLKTRIEAFAESLRTEKGKAMPISQKPKSTGSARYALGIDSGSTSTNAVLVDASGSILAHAVQRTGARAADSARRVYEQVLAQAGRVAEDIDVVVSTGYGRVSLDFADFDITEITCHAAGAHALAPEVRTIIDIGGQDSKAIRLDEAGEVVDFAMNDKCAAGTGRFLEAMARTLEVQVDELGELSSHARHKVEITSMCTVFAESEVISLIAKNVERADIAQGVHEAIAAKTTALAQRVKPQGRYMMTGGVARNVGVVRALEERIGEPLIIADDPDIVGAYGAALLGLRKLMGD